MTTDGVDPLEFDGERFALTCVECGDFFGTVRVSGDRRAVHESDDGLSVGGWEYGAAFEPVCPECDILTWRDYGASSVKDFLKHYTDGDYGHGGRRFRCRECPPEENGGSAPEFSDPFGARDHVKFTHRTGGLDLPDGFEFDDTFEAIHFNADGERIDPDADD